MLWYHYATTYLTCEQKSCKLKIIPPHRKRGLTLQLDREQIISGRAYKVDENGETLSGVKLEHDSYGILFHQYGKGASIDGFDLQRKELQKKVDQALTEEDMEEMQKYGSAAFTDPDLREKFAKQKRSIAEKDMNAVDGTDDEDAKDKKTLKKNYDLPSLEGLEDFAVREADGQYLLTMRKYNVGHKRRRVTALVNKINLYTKGSKDRLLVRENRIVKWQGILGIVLGIFSFLLSLLLGQYSEPVKKNRTRGPGSRAPRKPDSYSSHRVASIPKRKANHPAHQNSKAYGGYVAGKSTFTY